MSGKRIWKEIRKKHGTDRKKRAAVGVLLFCLIAGCGEKGKIQEIPTVAPDRQEGNAGQAGGTDGPSQTGTSQPTAGASQTEASQPTAGTSQDGAKKPTSEAQPDSTGGLSGKPQPGGITAPAASFDPATTTAKDPSLPPNPSGDFLIMQDTLVRYNGTADTVVVPENVTTIGAAAFRGNTTLVYLVLPEGVGTIEEDAFGNCRSLVEASLPKSLESVGDRAFAGCSALREINLQNVLELGTYAFSKCFALTDVELTALKDLGDCAFSGSGVEKVAGLEALGAAGGNVFASTPFWENYRETYGQELFIRNQILLFGRGCGGRLEIPQGVQVIAADAFFGESVLSEVVIPESVTEIGSHAFDGCPLSAVYMPRQDIRVWQDAFGWETGQLMIFPYSDGQLQEYDPDFLVAGTTLLAYRGEAVDIAIPGYIKVIGEEAFETKEDIVRVSLPEGVTEIRACAFFGCDQLREVSMPPSLATVGFEAFGLCSSLEEINLAYAGEIAEEAFMDCKKLESVELSAVKTLGDRAFAGSGVCRVGGLDPSAAIGEEIFFDTPFFKENAMWIVGNTLLDGRRCTGGIIIPEGVEKIAKRAFYKTSVTSVTCPKTLQEIGEEAFRECMGLTKITMGDAVISLGERAFAGDTSLSDVRLSAGLSEVPSFAFEDCGELWMLTIPEGCAAYGLLSQFTLFDGYGLGRTRLITVPPTRKVPEFLKDTLLSGDKIYTTKLPDGSDWEEQSKRFGWSIECLELTVSRQELRVGEQYQIIFNSGAKADWHSEDEAVVSVDADGMLCGKGVGKTDVVAVIYGKEYRCEVEVVE